MKTKLEEKLVATNPYEEAIKRYIIENASDEFALKVLNSDKNLRDCYTFIAMEIYKDGFYIRSGSVGTHDPSKVTDEYVYSKAMHYFEEDDIKKVESFSAVGVKAAVPKKPNKKSKAKAEDEDLDEEDIEDDDEKASNEEIARKAIEAYKEEQRQIAENKKKKAEAEKKAKEEAKRKAQEEIESKQTSLFDFL